MHAALNCKLAVTVVTVYWPYQAAGIGWVPVDDLRALAGGIANSCRRKRRDGLRRGHPRGLPGLRQARFSGEWHGTGTPGTTCPPLTVFYCTS